MNKTSADSRKGSALLLALCAIAVMSLTVLGLVEFTDIGLEETAAKEKDFRALQLAESGLALGLHPQVEKLDPVLQQTINPSESFSVKFRSEGAKLNINTILLGNDQKPLEDLFTRWKVKSGDRSKIIDCLMDWVDGNPLKRLNGAEQRDYERKGLVGYPPNRPFQNLDEMDLVQGIDLLSKAKPDWKDSFTVWGDGRLDLNEASAELIEAITGVGSLAAENFVKRRLGPDGKIDTEDDFLYRDNAEARNALGLSEAAFKTIEPKITLKSPYRRIESTGKVGTHERSIAVVVRLNTQPAQYLTWIEY